jgi:DNA-binding MarR family transcriptional regulator
MSRKSIPSRTLPAGLGHEGLMGRELSNAVVFFHEAIASHLGMTAAEWKCLGLLGQYGPSPPRRLAELSGFTTGAITGIVDRLERAGYARREAHPTDRRSVIICALQTERIEKRVAPIFQSLIKAMAEVSSKFTAAELSAIAAFLTGATEALRAETAKLKQMKPGRGARN